MTDIRRPWQYSFPPFFTLQPHAETRSRQIAAWRALILERCGTSGVLRLDLHDIPGEPPFSNSDIDRSLRPELLQAILSDLEQTGHATPTDTSRRCWDVYRSTISELSKMIRTWATDNGMNGTVCTLFELSQGDDTVGESFHGIDIDVLTKALEYLETNGYCELITTDDGIGVKFF